MLWQIKVGVYSLVIFMAPIYVSIGLAISNITVFGLFKTKLHIRCFSHMKQETKSCFGSGLSIVQSLCVSNIPRLHDQSWNINLNGLGITSSWRS